MISSARSSQASTTVNEDNRIVADGSGIGINTDGNVTVQVVADEAFELAEMALDRTTSAFAEALDKTQQRARTESAQLGEQLIKIGIPAMALIYLVGRISK